MTSDFAKIARDVFVEACGEVTHVEIESAIRQAYRAGMGRAAEIAKEYAADVQTFGYIPADPFEAMADGARTIATAIRAEMEKE